MLKQCFEELALLQEQHAGHDSRCHQVIVLF